MKHCIIIGSPVAHSLSPAMHTAGYKVLGIENSFTFTCQEVKPEELEEALRALRARADIRGITVTMPHKEAVMPYLDEVDEVAHQIGAVNSIVVDDGRWIGHNTDWYGIATPLLQAHVDHDSLGKATALIIGVGGAAKAAAYALAHSGYQQIYVSNRSAEKGREFAARYGLTYLTPSELSTHTFGLVFNATPIGMGDLTGTSPFAASMLHPGMVVFDSIYHPRDTRLLQDATRAGAITIPGWQMLLYQGVKQFELYTSRPAPLDAMHRVLHS